MKKIILFCFLLFTVLSFSDCLYVDDIQKDPLGSSVLNVIQESKLNGRIYCGSGNYYMVYYFQDKQGLQVGLSYTVSSLKNSPPRDSFVKDVQNIYNKVKKNLNGQPIHFRMYLQTASKTYQYGSIFITNGKEYHFSNENNYDPDYSGQPFFKDVIFNSHAHNGFTYTDDIMY